MMHTLDKSIYMLLLLTKCLSVFPTHIYETIHSKVRHIHKFRSPSGAHSQVAYLLQSHHLQLSLKQFQMLLPLLHRFHMFLLIYHAKVMMSTHFFINPTNPTKSQHCIVYYISRIFTLLKSKRLKLSSLSLSLQLTFLILTIFIISILIVLVQNYLRENVI